MKLFQYAVIYHPRETKDDKPTEKPKLIVEMSTVLAHDQAAATLLAARAIPEEYVDRLDQCEVAIRPF